MADKQLMTTANPIGYMVGGLSGAWGWATQNYEFLIPTIISVIILGMNWYYKHKEDRRQQERHDKSMRG